MSFLKKLFGFGGTDGGGPQESSELYEGYTITPNPQKTDGGFRLSAQISREIDGEVKTHQLIRADVLSNKDECITASINKAKQVVKEQGDSIFG